MKLPFVEFGSLAPSSILMSSISEASKSYHDFLSTLARLGPPGLAASILLAATTDVVDFAATTSIKAALATLETAGNIALHPPADLIEKARFATSSTPKPRGHSSSM